MELACDPCLLKPADLNVQPMKGVFRLNLSWYDMDNTSYEETFEIPKADIIKLQSPIKLFYNNVNQILNWTDDIAVRSHSETHHEWMHRIVVRQQDKIIQTDEIKFFNSYNLSRLNLKPNKEYNISVQVKVINKRNPYWSDVVHQSQRIKFSEIVVKIPKAIPNQPPNVTTGAFEVFVGKQGTKRMVKLYWTEVAEDDWNDDQISYVVDYGELGSGKMNTTENIIANHYRFQDFLVDVDYVFHIYSQNSIGRSRNYSRLVVAKQKNLLRRVNNVGVVQHNKDYEVLWLGPKGLEKFSDISYTIFWCQEAITTPRTCHGGITWKAGVKKNSTITLPPQHYHFGISVNRGEDISSGIEWTEPSCVVRDQNIDAHYRIRSRLELLQTGKDNLQIGIADICLSHRKVLIHSFVITYCAMLHHKVIECHERKVADPWLDRVQLDGLLRLRKYHISVAALADQTQEPLSNSSIIGFPDHVIAASQTLVHSIKANGANNFTVLITSMAKIRQKADYFKLTYQHQSYNCSIPSSCTDDKVKEETMRVDYVDEDTEKLEQMTCSCQTDFEKKPAPEEISLQACTYFPDTTDYCWTEHRVITMTNEMKTSFWEWILIPTLVIISTVLIALLVYLRIKYLRDLKEKAKSFKIPTLANRNLSLAELDGMFNNDENLYGVYGDELNGLFTSNNRSAVVDASFGGGNSFRRSGSAGSKNSKTALLDASNENGVYKNHNDERHLYEGVNERRDSKDSDSQPTELKTFKVAEPHYNNIDGNNGWKPPEKLPLKTTPPPPPTLLKTANVTGSYVSPDALMSIKTVAATNGHIGINGTNLNNSTMV